MAKTLGAAAFVGIALVAGRLSAASAAVVPCPADGLSGVQRGSVTLTTDCFVGPSERLVVRGDLTIASGATFLLSEGATVAVGRDLTVEGGLRFRDSSTLDVQRNADVFGDVDLSGSPRVGVRIHVGKNLSFYPGSSAQDALGLDNVVQVDRDLTVDGATTFRLKEVALSVDRNLTLSGVGAGELWVYGDSIGGMTTIERNTVDFIYVFGSFDRGVVLDGNSTSVGTDVTGEIGRSLVLRDNTDAGAVGSPPRISVGATIQKNLVCSGNDPAPQLVPSLGFVEGHGRGQCATPVSS